MLNERGRLIGDFTLCRLAEDRVFLIGTYAAENYYLRWFERTQPGAGVTVRPCAMEYVGLSVAGPEQPRAAAALVDEDLSNAAFPFLSFRAHGCRHGPGVGRPRFLHRRPRLRNLGHDRLPARAL